MPVVMMATLLLVIIIEECLALVLMELRCLSVLLVLRLLKQHMLVQ